MQCVIVQLQITSSTFKTCTGKNLVKLVQLNDVLHKKKFCGEWWKKASLHEVTQRKVCKWMDRWWLQTLWCLLQLLQRVRTECYHGRRRGWRLRFWEEWATSIVEQPVRLCFWGLACACKSGLVCIVMQTKVQEKLKSQRLVDIWNTLENWNWHKQWKQKRLLKRKWDNENQAQAETAQFPSHPRFRAGASAQRARGQLFALRASSSPSDAHPIPPPWSDGGALPALTDPGLLQPMKQFLFPGESCVCFQARLEDDPRCGGSGATARKTGDVIARAHARTNERTKEGAQAAGQDAMRDRARLARMECGAGRAVAGTARDGCEERIRRETDAKSGRPWRDWAWVRLKARTAGRRWPGRRTSGSSHGPATKSGRMKGAGRDAVVCSAHYPTPPRPLHAPSARAHPHIPTRDSPSPYPRWVRLVWAGDEPSPHPRAHTHT